MTKIKFGPYLKCHSLAVWITIILPRIHKAEQLCEKPCPSWNDPYISRTLWTHLFLQEEAYFDVACEYDEQGNEIGHKEQEDAVNHSVCPANVIRTNPGSVSTKAQSQVKMLIQAKIKARDDLAWGF